MGKISVGDYVFDENGNICQVLAKSNIDCSEQAYRITFKDGDIIESGANHEWCGEVYGCASDRQQASIVFDVAVDMVEQCPLPSSREYKAGTLAKKADLQAFKQLLSSSFCRSLHKAWFKCAWCCF